jgi:hypothetical protein
MEQDRVLALARSRGSGESTPQPERPTDAWLQWGEQVNSEVVGLKARVVELEAHLTELHTMFTEVCNAVRIRLDRNDQRIAKAEQPKVREIDVKRDSHGEIFGWILQEPTTRAEAEPDNADHGIRITNLESRVDKLEANLDPFKITR